MSGGGQFIQQFLDDYFAECDEHLATARRVLLEIENGDGLLSPFAELQNLQRALHTLKGLSGMVGLSSAERMAHALEDGIRVMTSAQGPPNSDLVEELFEGVALLDRCIASRRANVEPPSIDSYLLRMQRRVGAARVHEPPTTDASDSRVTSTAVTGTVYDELRTHRFEFSPSGAIAARGIGVETIRKRLQTLGDIVEATPRLLPAGGVTFEFVVAVREGASPEESWRADGLTWDAWVEDAVPSHALMPMPRAAAPAPSVPSNVVRVDLNRLDDLMRMVGELVVSRSRVNDLLQHGGNGGNGEAWESVREATVAMERQLRALREGVMRIRLVHIGEVFERMRFAMRDIVRETGKAVRLEFSGQDTELDKLVVDRMLEPLLHLVRNAASHGIENAAERRSRGKPADGYIALRARTAGDRIIIEVEDDGAGIDRSLVTLRGRELGLVSAHETVRDDALLDVICAPGLSTRDTVDMASGRGIGMAVVRNTVRELRGEMTVESHAGHGTRFTIELPLTLMIADALLVEVGGQAMAIPQIVLREIVPIDPSSTTVTQLENNEVMSYRGGVLPLVSLRRLFNLGTSGRTSAHVLVVGNDTQFTGLVVDRVLGLREIVIHPIDDPLVNVPGVAGATELADGRVSLILDAAALVRRTRAVPAARVRPPDDRLSLAR